MTAEELRREIEALAATERPARERARTAVGLLLEALESGAVRAAEPAPGGAWRVHAWVKHGILLAFRAGDDRPLELGAVFHFRDRDILPTWSGARGDAAPRIVPGGTTLRRGSHLAPRVVIMPPSYVNVGAWVGEGTMIDSHVLVGSCAQVGAGVHLSAGVQIGGVLEPIGALPVIVEDRVFVGGGCGIFEGVRVGEGAILAPGVMLTRSVPVHDLVHGRVLRAGESEGPLVPPEAVVVPGSRPATGDYAQRHGLHLQAPMIVKYRDRRTEAAVELERALR